MDTTQVLVVGAGPAGLALAGELRLGGAEVMVVERLPAPMAESRASTLHALTMELLDQRGLLPALGPTTRGGRGHFGGIPLELGDLPTSHPGVWKTSQARLEAVLAGWAHGLGAVIRRGTELRDLDQGPDGVEAVLAGASGEERVHAEYVVGCDGEDSTVAGLGTFDLTGTGPTREMLRADLVGVDVPDRRFERHERGLAVSSTGFDQVTRVMTHVFGQTPSAGQSAPDLTEVAAAWHEVTGQDVSEARMVWSNRFGDVSMRAARYRDGRVLLAGDAAHRQMPVGGQALNLGLHDALNLGWKLAAHVRGRAPDWLLDSYDEERRAEGARALDLISAQTLMLLGGHEVDPLRLLLAELMEHQRARRALAMRVSGLDVCCRSHTGGNPLEGRRPVHDLLSSSDSARVRTALATGRGVLVDLISTDSNRTVSGPRRERAEKASARPRSERSSPVPGWLLLRPDGYVAASGPVGTDPASDLGRWFPGDAVSEVVTVLVGGVVGHAAL